MRRQALDTLTAAGRLTSRRRGFTLIEVLVVISVISILVAMLFPGVRAALWSSKAQNSRNILAQIGIAIELFRDMQGSYPEGAAFCGPKLTEELGSLLKTRQASYIDTNADRKLDTVVDAWGRPFIYTRYMATSGVPGSSNGEGGKQPINNPTTYDLFSCGAYADKVIAQTTWDLYQGGALANNGSKYDHDGEKLMSGSKPTGEINRYIGNW